MINSIDLFAAFKASKPGSGSSKPDFPVLGTEKANTFRDSLREADRSISRESGENGSIRRDMAGRAEAKLKKSDKQSLRDYEKIDPQEEKKEKIAERIEEILAMLQKLADLQQDSQSAPESQEALQEQIKGAYQELAAIQSKLEKLAGADLQGQTQLQESIAEFRTLLERILSELKADGTENAGSNFLQKLETAVEEALLELEAITGAPAESSRLQNEADKLENPAGTAAQTEADTAVDGSGESRGQEKNTAGAEEDSKARSATEYGDTGTGAEAVGNKTAKKGISAENTGNGAPEEETAALEEKVEKITVASRESGKQDNESAAGGEASKEIHPAAAVKQNKAADEGMVNMLQEQALTEDKAEAAANQTETPRAQSTGRAEIINQIVKKAEIVLTDSQSEMRMQLEPENLGKLTLKVAVERGLITAKFTAESYEVKQVIESSFNELKDLLQEKGLEVQSFSVSVGQENQQYDSGNAFQQWKETVKLSGNRSKGGYEGYFSTGADTPRAANPYSVHNGEFDHIA